MNIGFIGLGRQFKRLFNDAMVGGGIWQHDEKILRVKAICDISPFQRAFWSDRLKKSYKQEPNSYEDYKEMLVKEKGKLDALFIATPDWMHAPIAIAAMEAGIHVYCEKAMSIDLAMAKRMVQTSKKTGMLLQIGHQRRSNPRYIAAKKLIKEYKLLGEIRNINAQWNRSLADHTVPLPTDKKAWLKEADLKRHGYNSMQELCNWRWYKKYCDGPLADLGSHQLDVLNWFLDENTPNMVMASGGKDLYKHQLDENIMAIYNYKTDAGSVRAFYQTLNSTSFGTYGNYYEVFMGEYGILLISEKTYPTNNGWFLLESHIRLNNITNITNRWDKAIMDKMIGPPYSIPSYVKAKQVLTLGCTDCSLSCAKPHRILTKYNGPAHTPHIQNFLDAINGKAKLNCPGEIGYKTAVSVHHANESIKNGDSWSL